MLGLEPWNVRMLGTLRTEHLVLDAGQADTAALVVGRPMVFENERVQV